MKQIRHIINDDEKEILDNFFFQQGTNSRQNYLNWLDSFFSGYGIFKSEDSQKSIYSANYSIDMIWDNNSNTSLAQHLVKNPKYKHSNSLFNNIKKFHSNFKHLDNNGNNLLHTTAKYEYTFLMQLLKNNLVDTDLLNNDGKSYHMIFTENFNSDSLTSNPKLHHIKDLSNKISLVSILFNNVNEFINHKIYETVKHEHLNQFINKNEQLISHVEKMWNDYSPKLNTQAYKKAINETQEFSSKLTFIKLSTNLSNKHSTAKMKI